MFGFLKLQGCGLDPNDRWVYQSHFCSVCHAMTRFGGRVSSLLTNYDITFWLLLASALEQRPPSEVEARPCTALPLRKVPVRPLSPELADTMAALNLILVESKAADDLQDGERFKATVVRAAYRAPFVKARDHLLRIGFPLQTLLELPRLQAQAEQTGAPTLQSLRAATASSLGEVFAVISKLHGQPELEPKLRSFGAHLGGYLYLWDATVDLASDTARGRFNAVNAVSGGYLDEAILWMRTDLDRMEEILRGLALGPEGKLCRGLLVSLRQRLKSQSQPCLSSASSGLRRRLAKAGMVRQSSCCESEVDCCDCGCCDCNLCNCDPCERDHSQCCELNCCDLSCCCCSTSERRSSSCCCNLFDDDCCDSSKPSSRKRAEVAPARQKRSSQRNPGQRGWAERLRLKASDLRRGTTSAQRCPGCDFAMISLSVGEIKLEECRNCGGIWLDDTELDYLAQFAELPHNLLHRYPTEEWSKTNPRGHRTCPVCEGEPTLVHVPYLDVPVEMCRSCHGFWFEHGVLNRVIRAKRSPERLSKEHQQEWRCPYCENVAVAGSDTCSGCGAPRPKSGFTGKLG